MRAVHLCESDEGRMKNPFARRRLLNPMSSCRKVGISIGCLPTVAGQADLANLVALLERVIIELINILINTYR